MDTVERKLVQLRRRDENARRLFDVLRTQPTDWKEPKVALLARKSGLRERDVRAVFATLEGLNLGRLIVGRRGASTRFEWSEDFSDRKQLPGVQVGEEEARDAGEASAALNVASAKGVQVTEWTLNLDSRRRARVVLPTNLTKGDVAKLLDFAGALQARISV